MMKKYVIVAVLLGSASAAVCQESHLYFKAGVNAANITNDKDGSYNEANSVISYHAGLSADLPLSRGLSVQPSLLFTGKGAKISYGENTGSNPTYFDGKFNPYYIELPVNLVAKIPLAAEESSFFIGAGPYASIGVAGKHKKEGKIFGSGFTHEGNIRFSDDDPTTTNYEEDAGFGIVKRFDYGLNGTAGLQFSSFIISANYGYGLAKIASGTNNDGGDNNKHRVISVSLGVRL
jgi:hypothetical protein